MHGLEAEYWGQVDFIYLDREDAANKDIVERFGVVYQPVLILLDADGSEVQRWFYLDADEVRAAFDAQIGANG